MNNEIRNLLRLLKEYAEKDIYISALVVFGSLGRKNDDYFSDGDFIIYLHDNSKIGIIKRNIKKIFENENYHIGLEFQKYNKWILFIQNTNNEYLLKIEITFSDVSKIRNDIIYVIQSRIKNPEDAVVVDKVGIIRDLKKYWFSLKDKIKEEFYNILNSFIYYYDDFLNRYARGDVYRAWMNYTICIYKLASMVALAHGEYRNLYQPWFLTRDIINNTQERETIKKVIASLDPLDIFKKKQELVGVFMEYSLKASKQFGITFNYEKYKRLIEQLEEKYYQFYNFRDVSKIVNLCSEKIKIKKEVIFRSASLSRYEDSVILDFLERKNIRWIIDLRSPEEIKRYEKNKNRRYGKKIEKYVVSIPMNTYTKIREFLDPYMNLYYAILTQNQKEINEIFSKYLINVENGGVIIHCEGGKDRTGIIIALLLDFLGVERECIIEDYLASFSDTKRENIEFLFKIIDENFNGINNYLYKECRIDTYALNKIKNILVVNNEDNHNW